MHFDLVGLPPKPEGRRVQRDRSRDAYEKLVDRLLASPHYGERMAIGWLDVVRFADTIGYHSDNPRNIWPYRDYVIHSFDRNTPLTALRASNSPAICCLIRRLRKSGLWFQPTAADH